MKQCKYTYNNKEYSSYLDLFKYIYDNVDVDEFNDIVYSVASNQEENEDGNPLTRIQRELKAKLDNIKTSSKISIDKVSSKLSSDGDPISASNVNNLHITQLIDDDRFKDSEGNLYVPLLNKENYIKNLAEILLTRDNLSSEDAINIATREYDSFEKKKFDAYIIHAICRKYFNNDDITLDELRKTINELISTNSSNLKFILRAEYIKNNNDILDLLKNIYFSMRKTGIVKESKIIYNVPVEKEILLNGSKIKIHDTIDKIVIYQNGHIDLIKYKITEDEPANWPKRVGDAKIEKYKYELAFLKNILEDKGINFNNNFSLKIFAVQLDYDHSDDKIDLLPILKIHPNVFDLQMDIVDGNYTMTKHLNIARNIILPEIKVENCTKAVEIVNKQLNLIWPEKGISLQTQLVSIELWIKDNKNTKIIKIDNSQDKYKYKIYLGKDIEFIKEDNPPESNSEIHEKVQKYLEKKGESNQILINDLQTAIEQASVDHYLNVKNLSGFYSKASNIADILRPYFNYELTKSGDKIPIWKYIKNSELAAYNILLFENQKTNQIDVINITNLNLNSTLKLSKGTNLAGSYLMNLDAKLPNATYGLISGIKIISLINQLMESLGDKRKLGDMKIITSYNNGYSENYNIETFINKIYKPLIKIVNDNFPDDQIKFNLSNLDFIDEYDTIRKQLEDILGEGRNFLITQDSDEQFKAAAAEITKDFVNSDEVRLSLMESLLHVFETFYGNQTVENLTAKIRDHSYDAKVLTLIKLIYEYVTKLKNRLISQGEEVDSFLTNIIKPGNIKSSNFQITVKNWSEYSLRILDSTEKIGEEINKLVIEYYEKAGYTNLLNKLIGNQTSKFINLFDENNPMRFKDPYDMTNGLLDYERKFLKHALLIFAKYRYINKNFEFNITNPDSKECLDFIEKNSEWYFNCPLRKTSSASAILSGYGFKYTKERILKLMTDPKLWLQETLDKQTLDEYVKDNLEKEDVMKLSVRNYFSYGESDNNPNETCNSSLRGLLLDKHKDVNYFEHNIEDLLRDFTFESIRALNMRAFMFDTKLQLLLMNLKGEDLHTPEKFESEIKLIKDFIKINVYHISTMSKTELKLATVVLPLKKLITNLFIPGNIAGMARDINEGFLQSIVKSINKVGTDISPKDVIDAYGIITKDTISNPKMSSLVHQLCIKYRISNIDVSNVAEGLKTGNRGIVNFDNFMYQTMRRPDFLNRMVLFVAKCKHDGCWDALSVDDYGDIQYDWKKDKRFNLLATDNKNNIENYNKQKSLFLSLIRQWNLDHPENQTSDYNNLPMPYSELEVKQNKDLADNIYGAYDRSTKSMGEYRLLMLAFGNFTTWMNGLIESYYKLAGPDKSKFSWEQATDNSGNLLYFTETGELTTENTGYIVYNQVPIWTQGIILTLNQMRLTIFNSELTLKDVFSNKVNLLNANKAISDVAMTALYYFVIRVLLNAFRDKQKEETDPHDILTNAVCEILYKGLYNSWDGFKGPLNVIQYLGEQTNPPIYTEGISVAKDLVKVVSGDMNIISLGSRHIAPMRSFKQTIKADITGKLPS